MATSSKQTFVDKHQQSWKCTAQSKKPMQSRYDVKLTFVY